MGTDAERIAIVVEYDEKLIQVIIWNVKTDME